MRWLVTAVFAFSACTVDDDGGGTDAGIVLEGNFNQHALRSLGEDCEGVAGLSAQSILDQRVDHVDTPLSYITAQGARVNATTLAIDVTWPASPVATCYPSYFGGSVSADPRVAIEGLTLRFHTADGKFDETLAAKAWRVSSGGTLQVPLILAVTARPLLHGTWTPFAEYQSVGSTVSFAIQLAGASTSSGNVGLGGEIPAELNAAIFRSRFAVALFP